MELYLLIGSVIAEAIDLKFGSTGAILLQYQTWLRWRMVAVVLPLGPFMDMLVVNESFMSSSSALTSFT